MRNRRWIVFVGFVALVALGVAGSAFEISTLAHPASSGAMGEETHLTDLRQLTFGGENAEAYYSLDGQRLIFQTRREGVPCDQIYTMNVDGSEMQRVSTGEGRTTCGYFFPDGQSIVYASTHLGGAACPPEPGFEMGYVWPIYDSYDIFTARPDGSGLPRITDKARAMLRGNLGDYIYP